MQCNARRQDSDISGDPKWTLAKRPLSPLCAEGAEEHEALIESSVTDIDADVRWIMLCFRTQASIMRVNDQFEILLLRFKGHPACAARWHACTPDPELVVTFSCGPMSLTAVGAREAI